MPVFNYNSFFLILGMLTFLILLVAERKAQKHGRGDERIKIRQEEPQKCGEKETQKRRRQCEANWISVSNKIFEICYCFRLMTKTSCQFSYDCGFWCDVGLLYFVA